MGRAASGAAGALIAVLTILALLIVALGIFARPDRVGISRLAGHPLFTVLSGSMRPVFNPGDLIVDEPISSANAQRLVAGDIITFHVNNSTSSQLITHKIIGVEHTSGSGAVSYQTKGVANNTADAETVWPTQIVGTYRARIPFGGYLMQWAHQRIVLVVLVAAPILYLLTTSLAMRPRNAAGAGTATPEVPSALNDGTGGGAFG